MSPVLTPDRVVPAEATTSREALLTLCHDLQTAGIWLYLQDETTLIAGPPELVRRHPALLAGLRTHKPAILRLLQDSLAGDMCGTAAHDSRFVREVCPDCQRPCYVIYPPRRLEVHRMPDNQTVCPGSERAQA